VPIDPQVQSLLDTLNQIGFTGISRLAPDAAGVRAAMRQMRVPTEVVEVREVRNLHAPGPAGPIAVRTYRDRDGNLPMLVWYHGGGWTIGDLETADATCRELARRSGTLVVSVEYRLGPEHPFPAAVDDAWAGLEWAAEHGPEIGGQADRLAVGGDSAGGNLAAVVALKARDVGAPELAFQLLVYPATDARLGWPSLEENGRGYFMSREDVAWFYRNYGLSDPEDWRVSPLLASSHAGLPPAWILTAEYDPLRDEGQAYGRALTAAGVRVESVCYPGMIHGFFGMHATVDAAGRALDEAAAALRTALLGPAAGG
jgi:acetyl esterase